MMTANEAKETTKKFFEKLHESIGYSIDGAIEASAREGLYTAILKFDNIFIPNAYKSLSNSAILNEGIDLLIKGGFKHIETDRENTYIKFSW